MTFVGSDCSLSVVDNSGSDGSLWNAVIIMTKLILTLCLLTHEHRFLSVHTKIWLAG